MAAPISGVVLDRLAAQLTAIDNRLAARMANLPPGRAYDQAAAARNLIAADLARVARARTDHRLLDEREPTTATEQRGAA